MIVPALFFYLLIIAPSGSEYCFHNQCGIYFWGVHGFDGIWHLAIINIAFRHFPFQAPTFAGANMTGYNYLFDLILYVFTFTGIPAITWYFKIFPLVWFIVFTGLLIALARKIKDSPRFVALTLFFMYFAGSFSYLLTLYHHQTIWGSAGQLATIAVHTMSNLQFAFSIPILLWMLIIVKRNKIDGKIVLSLAILNFINLGIKFYGGAITSFLAAIFIFFHLVKKNFRQMFVYEIVTMIAAGLAVFVFYDPLAATKTGAIFTVAPFALIHTITEEPDLLYSQTLTNARYFLITKGIGPKLILIEMFNFTAFVFFYLGVRFFGLLYVLYKIIRKKMDSFSWYVLLTIIFATLLSSVLVQKAEWWNVVQFFYYAIFLSAIFIAQLTDQLLAQKNTIMKLLVVIIIILAVPTSVDVVKSYAVFPGAAYVPQKELSALTFLKNQPPGIVLVPLFDESFHQGNGPFALANYADTAYVSAFTGKQTYFAALHPIRLMDIDYRDRLKLLQAGNCTVLNHVNYLYEIPSLTKLNGFAKCSQKMEKIYANDTITIYRLFPKRAE